MKRWPPDANSTSYSGPYPVNEIQQARHTLIQCLMPPHSGSLARVLSKIGIDSAFGPAMVPTPPPDVPNGWTTSYSHRPPMEKTTETSLSATKSASHVMSPPTKVSVWTPFRISRSVSVQDARQSSVQQTDQAQPGAIQNSPAQNAAIAKRRYSEFSATDDVMVKRGKDNGALVGQGDTVVTQENVPRIGGEPSSSVPPSSAKLPSSHVYKCDYCRVTATSDAEITSHLTRSRHASASEYIISSGADSGKGTPELQAVERMLAVTNPDKNNCAALVIACPECRGIFDDIFTCATHNKYEHGESDGCYAVCPVIQSGKVEVSNMSCVVCQQQFNDHNELVEHWVAVPDHCPMPQSSDNRVFLVQMCPVCKRTFNDDFLDCVIHMAEDHGSVTWVEVRHVMLPQRRERLPPFSSNIHSTGGLRDEAAVLSKLQNCFEQNAINARLEQIQKILAGIA